VFVPPTSTPIRRVFDKAVLPMIFLKKRENVRSLVSQDKRGKRRRQRSTQIAQRYQEITTFRPGGIESSRRAFYVKEMCIYPSTNYRLGNSWKYPHFDALIQKSLLYPAFMSLSAVQEWGRRLERSWAFQLRLNSPDSTANNELSIGNESNPSIANFLIL
jgi:hypothetical protein